MPRFYDRDDAGVPRAWMASVKQSMSTLAPTWDSLRMTREYTESYYLPGLARVRQLRSAGAVLARNLTREVERLMSNWPDLTVAITHQDPASEKGRRVELVVGLGRLDPADLLVQLWLSSEGSSARTVDATLVERARSEARYVATVEPSADGRAETVVARVLPSPRHTDNEAIPGLITWSQ